MKQYLYIAAIWISISSTYSFIRYRSDITQLRSVAVETFIQILLVQYLLSSVESTIIMMLSVIGVAFAAFRSIVRSGVLIAVGISIVSVVAFLWGARYADLVSGYLVTLIFISGLLMLIISQKLRNNRDSDT